MKRAYAVKLDTGKWKKLGIRMYGGKGLEYKYMLGNLYISVLRANRLINGGIASSLSFVWPSKVIDVMWIETNFKN